MDVAGLIAGSGWASGLNLYAVALLLGAAGRWGWADIPSQLTRTDVMITVGVLFFIEFAVDKIPFLDSLWDMLHTVVRPLGAAALGYFLAGEASSVGQAAGAMVAGSLALTSHSAKATTRAAVNTSPEPFSNMTLSVVEDGLAVGVTMLSIVLPLIAIGVVAVLAVLATMLAVRLFGAIRRLRGRLRPD
jgi:hypothetical protein